MGGAQERWKDRLTLPTYRVGEAAHYAQLSPSLVAYWQKPRGVRASAVGPRQAGKGISYLQMVEIAVVAALRKAGLKLPKIRGAREFMAKELGIGYPFAQARFKFDGAEVMRDFPGDSRKLVSASEGGQYVWVDVIEQGLQQFHYGDDGIVDLWRLRGDESPVRIDPRVNFGSPHVSGTPTWAIKDRWRFGESVADIADDYEVEDKEVIAALKFEGIEVDLSRPNKWVN